MNFIFIMHSTFAQFSTYFDGKMQAKQFSSVSQLFGHFSADYFPLDNLQFKKFWTDLFWLVVALRKTIKYIISK